MFEEGTQSEDADMADVGFYSLWFGSLKHDAQVTEICKKKLVKTSQDEGSSGFVTPLREHFDKRPDKL